MNEFLQKKLCPGWKLSKYKQYLPDDYKKGKIYLLLIGMIIIIPLINFISILVYSFFSYLLSKVNNSKKNYDLYFCLYSFIWLPFIILLLFNLIIKIFIIFSFYLIGVRLLISLLSIMWFIFLSSVGLIELNNFSV